MKIENMSPRRKARERRLWRRIIIITLIPAIMSMVFEWYVAFFISIALTFMSYVVYSYFVPDKDYGPTPWWYFGL